MYVSPHLPREIFGWHSHRLGLDMPLVRYGTRGHPLILFPTAAADFLENERFWLVKAVEHHILAGRCQIFSVDSINKHTWMNDDVHPLEKGRRQALYAEYIEEEVVPHIRRCVGKDVRVGASGASFGAFHAANQVFRRPDLFDTLVAMSGFYDLDPGYTEGHSSDAIYFNNPVAYLSNVGGDDLELLRDHTQIHIVTGQGAWEAPQKSRHLSQVLWDRGIWHDLDLWGHDVAHDWPSWRKMLDFYIGEKLGW